VVNKRKVLRAKNTEAAEDRPGDEGDAEQGAADDEDEFDSGVYLGQSSIAVP
jgi:hypothetical protein